MKIYCKYCLVGFVAENITTNITIPTQSDPELLMSVFGWIMIHQHLGYIFDWHLPWSEYKAGFGSSDADFCLGLERMHLLTSSRPYRLRVEVQHRSTNLWYSAEYWSFKIGDELNDRYRLEVSGYSGDAGDSLQYEGDYNGDGLFGSYYHNNVAFSTFDQGNGESVIDCASWKNGGWWFNNCAWACLTCDSGGFEWWTMENPGYAANGRMMIKPQ